MYSRTAVVNLAKSWIGKNEKDGSYKEIINIYNSGKSLPRNGLKMQPNWAWCACTWSALAIKLGYEAIMPIEISCGNLIEMARKMGIWQENDGFIPSMGDAILYDWQDSGKGDNTGWPDHIGVIEYVNTDSGYMVVIEGNYSDAVKRRTISINGRYIRGFITPKYDVVSSSADAQFAATEEKESEETIAREVIVGKWGNNPERRKRLEEAGYNYDLIQAKVRQILNGDVPKVSDANQNQPAKKKVEATCAAKKFDKTMAATYKVTAKDGLYCRNDAGTNKKALCKIPYGTEVKNYGYYNLSGSTKWAMIQFVLDGVQYTGFSSMVYLIKK